MASRPMEDAKSHKSVKEKMYRGERESSTVRAILPIVGGMLAVIMALRNVLHATEAANPSVSAELICQSQSAGTPCKSILHVKTGCIDSNHQGGLLEPCGAAHGPSIEADPNLQGTAAQGWSRQLISFRTFQFLSRILRSSYGCKRSSTIYTCCVQEEASAVNLGLGPPTANLSPNKAYAGSVAHLLFSLVTCRSPAPTRPAALIPAR